MLLNADGTRGPRPGRVLPLSIFQGGSHGLGQSRSTVNVGWRRPGFGICSGNPFSVDSRGQVLTLPLGLARPPGRPEQ